MGFINDLNQEYAMRTITYTEARKNLAAELDRVVNDCDVTIRCEAWSEAKPAGRVVPGSPSAGRVRD
jgi:hypothetical protein